MIKETEYTNYYKLIVANYNNESLEYFKEMNSSNNPVFTYEMDLAMNFNTLQDSEINHYLELISNKVWKNKQYKDIIGFDILELNFSLYKKITSYENEEFETMKAINKLTTKEIELLGLEDFGLLNKLQTDDEENNVVGPTYYTALSYIQNNLSPEEQLIKSIKENWKETD